MRQCQRCGIELAPFQYESEEVCIDCSIAPDEASPDGRAVANVVPIATSGQVKRTTTPPWSHPALAEIGPYRAMESPNRPPLDDVHTKRWFDGFAEMAWMILQDTERVVSFGGPGGSRVGGEAGSEWYALTFVAFTYELTGLAAFHLCEAWAQGAYLYARDGYATRPTRIQRAADAIVFEMKAGGAKPLG